MILNSKQIVRINRDDFNRVSSLYKFIDVAGRANDQTVDIVMDSLEIEKLKNSGIKYYIVEKKFYKDVYPTTAQVYDSITKLATKYPSLVDVETIGFTYNNRPLVIMKINGKNPDTCLVRYQFLLMANHHAREWQTISTALFFVDSILRAYSTNSTIKKLIDSTYLVVFPMVNPDGYYYSMDQNNELWRKNRTLRNSVYGVDINRNYPGEVNGDIRGEWGAIYNSSTTHYPSSDVYCGPYSGSEREVQSVMNLAKRFSFNISISLHSYSELVLYPWGATSDTALDNTLLSNLATKIASKMLKQTSGTYTPEKSDALYPTSGDSDGWIYGYTKFVKGFTTLPFTFEIDTGFSPPTTTLAQLHRRVFPGILYSAFLCESVYGVPKEVPLKPILSSSGSNIIWNLKNSNKADYYKVQNYDSIYTYKDSLNGSIDSIISTDYKTYRIELSKTTPYSAPYSLRPLKKDTTISSLEFFDRLYVQNITDSLIFYMQYDLETNYDKAFLEYSYDGFFYEPLDTLNGIFTGSSTTWKRYSFPLSRFLNKEITIRLKTVYDDGTINATGLKIDNIYPVPTAKTRTTLFESCTDTFISSTDTLKYFFVTSHHPVLGFTHKSDRYFFKILRSVIKDSLGDIKENKDILIDFSNRILTIKNSSKAKKSLRINIFDVSGRKVFEKNVKVENVEKFDLNFLASGKYYLVILGDKNYKEGILILK
uniref:carboxypeptidase T n=1 Tax=candidate division WOR-3 bacterium TaxID=2052148 RepID=A0A7C3J716_UNCW3